MVRRRVKNKFKPTHLINDPGMMPKGDDELYGRSGIYSRRLKSKQSKWPHVCKRKKSLSDARPKSNKKVKLLGAMMGHMGSPQNVDTVTMPVEPVKESIKGYKQKNKI